jgi:transposase
MDWLTCHPQTVRDHLHAFNTRGVDGLGMKPGSGRKPRLTEPERSAILALVKLPPPGKPTYELTGELEAPDPEGEPEWTLDTLTAAAQERGIDVARSQAPALAHLPPRGGALAAHAVVGHQQGSRLRPKRARIVALYTDPPESATVLGVDELGPVTPRNFPPAPGWSSTGHRIKVPLDYERGPDKTWVYGALCVRNGQTLTQTASARNTAGYLSLLQTLDQAYPHGDLHLVADNCQSC